MKLWPALDIPAADDLVLAALDDFAPTAIEEREFVMRVFFATRENRDEARAQLAVRQVSSVAVDVPDDDWAARSQENLTPITVGRITVLPTPHPLLPVHDSPVPRPRSHAPHASVGEARQSGEAATAADPCSGSIAIVIEPSMGFGTGHHATTRLCLVALQTLDVGGSVVVDVGTGSGILALAAARLGAARVHAIDVDRDSVQCANDNLALNPDARNVTFAVADMVSIPMPTADVVVANLTGASLVRAAGLLLAAVRSGGTLIVSGILATEEDEVRPAFGEAECLERTQEDEWVCLTMKKR
jgi:ribosomal protein L11 methylase PrmA